MEDFKFDGMYEIILMQNKNDLTQGIVFLVNEWFVFIFWCDYYDAKWN